MLRHLCSLIPGKGTSHLLGQGDDSARDGCTDRFCPMTGKGWSVLHPSGTAIGCHARQMQQEREPCRSFYQSADRRTLETKYEISLPMARYRPICNFRGALADHYLGRNERFALAADPHARHAQGTARTQTGGQLAAQRAAALHVKGLVNRLVTDTHRIISRKVQRQAPGDLFRAPGHRPAPLLPASKSPPFPCHLWPIDLYPIVGGNRTRKPFLHITAQDFILDQLGWFGTAQRTIGMPLRGGGSIFQSAAACCVDFDNPVWPTSMLTFGPPVFR